MDDYVTIRKIGDGAFGSVYLCKKQGKTKSPSSEQLYAVKKMKKRYETWDDCMKLREVRALVRLDHPNIVALKEVVRENNYLYLVFEHMDENLHQHMRAHLTPLTHSQIVKIVFQILNGLSFIHDQGFFHRDIKPENLLCRNGAIKIADFGLTREISSEPPYTEYVSTRWYRAPELLLHSTHYSWSVDIWALGCIIGELYTMKPMFPGRSEIDQIFKICQALGKPNAKNWPEGERLDTLIKLNLPNIVPLPINQLVVGCPTEGVDFIEDILKWVPSSRPNAKQLLAHRYFKEQ